MSFLVKEKLTATEKASEEPMKVNEEEISFKAPVLPTDIRVSPKKTKEEELSSSDPLDLSYSAPSWGLQPSSETDFSIDVIKNGVVVEKIKLHSLKNSSFVCIGRFPPSDIQLDHPSVSRHHCILQYGKLVDKPEWYLYDMGSTHGTKLNKKPAKKHCYIQLRPGYVFQIAGSSRVFSFCGPISIEENEKKEPVDVKPQQGPASKEDEKKESSKSENPGEEKPDPKYFDKDPIGWLDKYFEREGLQMNFQYSRAEAGADWVCSIELADDVAAVGGNLISASAFTRQLAQFQCALVACERLEVNGLLRTFSIWNKRKTYADNDYYDSDEDTFLDRTGQIEEQRRKRKMRIEGDENVGKSKSYDELSKSLTDAENKLVIVKSEIQRLLGKNTYTDADGNIAKTANFSMKSKEKKLLGECEELKKLIAFVKPHGLDEMFPMKPKEAAPVQENFCPNIKQEDELPQPGGASELNPPKQELAVSDSERNVKSETTVKTEVDEAACASAQHVENISSTGESTPPKKRERNCDPDKPDIIMPKFGILTKEEARVKHPIIVKRRQHLLEEELVGDDYSNVPLDVAGDYATWVPPKGQTGDGMTELNKKFGY